MQRILYLVYICLLFVGGVAKADPIFYRTNSDPGTVDPTLFAVNPEIKCDFVVNPGSCSASIYRSVNILFGRVSDVDIQVTFKSGMEGPPNFTEAAFALIHNGVRVRLITFVESAGVITLGFDDEAQNSLPNLSMYPDFISGSYRPEQALSAFDGLDAAGDWILAISDLNSDQPFTDFHSFSLRVDVVDEPAVILMLMVTFPLVFAINRRRKAMVAALK